MPATVAAWVAGLLIDNFIIGTAAYLAITGAAYLATALAINYSLGTLAKLLSGSDHAASIQTGQQFTLRETVGARTICYGQSRTSGLQVYEYTRAA